MSKTLTVINSEKSENSLSLSQSQALSLELQLNLSIHGKKWSSVGDVLYNFYVGKEVPNPYKISSEQFELLNSFDLTFH